MDWYGEVGERTSMGEYLCAADDVSEGEWRVGVLPLERWDW